MGLEEDSGIDFGMLVGSGVLADGSEGLDSARLSDLDDTGFSSPVSWLPGGASVLEELAVVGSDSGSTIVIGTRLLLGGGVAEDEGFALAEISIGFLYTTP